LNEIVKALYDDLRSRARQRGFVVMAELQQELEAGCGRFLRKPYVPKGLTAAIDELLRAPTR